MAKDDKNFEYEFDPVKMPKDGKKAEAVIWSTNSLNAAVEAIKKGLPLKANPFIGKQTRLLKPDLVYKRTEDEIRDYIKCKQDPIYFASKCYLMTPEGLQPCVLRDYQEDYLNHLKKNRFSIFLSCRQSGKTLNMLTNITILIKNDILTSQQLKKISYFYIKDNIYYLPIYEVYNLYCKQTFIWKIKYRLYKIIYNLTYGRSKRYETQKDS